LNYELETYIDAIRDIPVVDRSLKTEKGDATLQKTDIFRRIMWFSYPNETNWYPINCVQVAEIQKMNAAGKKPVGLENLVEISEFVSAKPTSINNDLERLDKKYHQNKKKSGPKRANNPNTRPEGNGGTRPNNPQSQQQQARSNQPNNNPNARNDANEAKPANLQGQQQRPNQPRPSQPQNRPNPPRPPQPKVEGSTPHTPPQVSTGGNPAGAEGNLENRNKNKKRKKNRNNNNRPDKPEL
jgi:hypothetical protein